MEVLSMQSLPLMSPVDGESSESCSTHPVSSNTLEDKAVSDELNKSIQINQSNGENELNSGEDKDTIGKETESVEVQIEPLNLKEITNPDNVTTPNADHKEDPISEAAMLEISKANFNKVMDDITSCLCDSEASTPSEGNTPRDDTSSGSPSPIPDDKNPSEKPRVKLGKDISLMMQALNSLNSPEEKIAALCKKYADLLESHKFVQKKLRAAQRKQAPMDKERCQLQTDLNKAMTMKTKMENVARELQKQNKTMRKEFDDKLSKMDKSKEVICNKFQKNLNDISDRMQEIADKNTELCDENRQMETKIKNLVEEYTTKEKILEGVIFQHSQREEILHLKLEKSELLLEKERQRFADEQLQMVKNENELRRQLLDYSEKMEDFESTLKKSNSVFGQLMGKIEVLEKSESEWRGKSKQLEFEQKKVLTKTKRLQDLCRALQNERNELLQKLKAYEFIKKPVQKVSAKRSKDGIGSNKNTAQGSSEQTQLEPKKELSKAGEKLQQNSTKVLVQDDTKVPVQNETVVEKSTPPLPTLNYSSNIEETDESIAADAKFLLENILKKVNNRLLNSN